MQIRLIEGDSLDVLRATPDGAYTYVVTDPPYGLSAPPDPLEVMRQWLQDGDYVKKTRGKAARGKGFMGAEWDHFVPGPVLWREVFRTCKPGAIVVCFAATRTMGWMSLSLQCAGFEILDTIAWLQAQGMAKAGTIDKKIDAHNGDERPVIGPGRRHNSKVQSDIYNPQGAGGVPDETGPASAESVVWAGWSTQLAPGYEPIIVARRPCEGTATANVLRHGCGAMHVEACQIENPDENPRWPKNVLLDPSAAAVLDDQVGERKSGSRKAGAYEARREGGVYMPAAAREQEEIKGSSGKPSRFFWVGPLATEDDCALPGRYVPKVRTSERHADLPDDIECTHPTRKPQALMRWLCRLAGQQEGRGLDPFAGWGSTLKAAAAEGLNMDGIERDVEYAEGARLFNGLPATEASGWIRLRNRLEWAIVPRPRVKDGEIKRDKKGNPVLFKPPGPTVAEIKAMGEVGRVNVGAWLATTGGDARILAVPFVLTPWAVAFTPPASIYDEGPVDSQDVECVEEWDAWLEREAVA
jgi:DNA modification methylase